LTRPSIIDSHVHLWSLDTARYPWQPTLAHVGIPTRPASVEDFIARADAAGVGHALAIQLSVYGWNNDYLCDCLERYGDRLIGVCMVDARSPEAAEALAHWCEGRRCRGLRINTIRQGPAHWLLDPARDALWDAAASLGVPVTLQIDGDHAPVIATLAARRPELAIVIEYLGPEVFARADNAALLGPLSEHANLYLKALLISGDSRRPWPFEDLWPFYRQATELLGADRLMFGSEYPTVCDAVAYDQAVRWIDHWPFLDAAQRAAIAGGTARRLWKLPA
jgi:predicted TIM-barrel fold metal-dependent hydrolase